MVTERTAQKVFEGTRSLASLVTRQLSGDHFGNVFSVGTIPKRVAEKSLEMMAAVTYYVL
jgi:hypothetical protein